MDYILYCHSTFSMNIIYRLFCSDSNFCRCGAIFPGDQIVAVNDTRVAGLRTAASDVYKLLRMCGGAQPTLRLEIIPVTTDFIHAECKYLYE